MIDVVIPAYIKNEQYIKLLQRALDSLSNQTFKNFTVKIVLNGCYTNKTEIESKILYKGEIEFLELKNRMFAGAARNIAFKQSNKKYIAQLDADDQFFPTKLEKQINFMEKNTNIEVLGTLYSILEGNKILEGPFSTGQYEYDKDIKNIIEYENVIGCGSVLFKKEVFDKYNIYYQETLESSTYWPHYGKFMWDDWDLWIRLCRAGAIFHNLQERLYLWTSGTSVGYMHQEIK